MNSMIHFIFLNKYISPSGMRMLWLVALTVVVLSFFWLWRVYRRHKNNPLRIKKWIWYSGGLKMSVNVRNIRGKVVEINTPEIEFLQPHMGKRRFKIVTPGDKNIFPLGLSPQTSYDFVVEFTRLYEREPILRKYRQAVIWVKDRDGKTITKKKVKISLPSS